MATYTTTLTRGPGGATTAIPTTIVAILPAPTGYTLDFEDPKRNADVVAYWISGVGMVMAFMFLAMRVYTKVVVVKALVMEDICLIVAWCFSVLVQSIELHMYHSKAQAVHAWEMPFARYNYYSIMVMVSSVCYVPVLGFAKFSLLLFYHRLTPLPWFRLAVYGLMSVVLGYSFAIVFALIFPCKPVAKNWDVTITDGTCINRANIYIATAVVNIATDISMLILPIPVLARLQMPSRQKIGLVLMFGIGSATFVTSIIRLKTMLPLLTSPDQTWEVSIPSIWVMVEANLVIVTGSLPIMRLFLRAVAPRLLGETSRRSGNSYKRKPSDIHTVGSKPSRGPFSRSKRSQYADIELNTVPHDLDDRKSDKEDGISDRAAGWHDSGSETAIVVTKETTIEYRQKSVTEQGSLKVGSPQDGLR